MFTRDPSTGENIFYGESLENVQGELDSLEGAIIALAQKAQKAPDGSQRRGVRIDAMLAKIDETIATLTSA